MKIPASALLRSTLLGAVGAALASAVLAPADARAQAGAQDMNFQTAQLNASVQAIALDPRTSQAVVGGEFTSSYDSLTNKFTAVTGVARLANNGLLDTTFVPPTLSMPTTNTFQVNAVAVQSNGSVIVGGNFVYQSATPRYCILRLLSNGAVDTANTNLGTGVDNSTGGAVLALAIQSDGKILVGGDFIKYNGVTINGLLRLNTDLTRDTSFVPDPNVVGYGGDVSKIIVQPNGSILILNQGNTPYRLTSSGAKDASFDASTVVAEAGADSFNTMAGNLALEADGKILAVLDYVTSTANGTFASSVVRLNSNGTLDKSFNYAAKITAQDTTEVPAIYDLLSQSDGTVVVAGGFAAVGGQTRPALARFLKTGLADGTFAPTVFSGQVFPTSYDLLGQNGYLLVGGTRPAFMRLNDLNAATPSFFDGESALANNVYYLSFANGNYFGYFSFLSNPAYIYHFDLGYEYVFNANDGKSGVYLYDFKSKGFFYSSPTFPFPYLYDFTLKTVLYYYPDPKNVGHYNTNGVRYFYDFATKKIISK